MKFNWGTGILLVIILFIGTMIGIVVFSMNQQVNLVSPDYYPKGVNHEEQIQKQRNLASLGSKITCRKENDSLYITFPDVFKNHPINGDIQFYFMTNYEKDIKKQISLNDSLVQVFSLTSLEPGRYIIKVDWSTPNKSYYQEIDINL